MFYVYAESIDTVWLKQQTEGKTFDHLQTMCKRNRKTLDSLYDQRRFSEIRNRPIFLKNQWFVQDEIIPKIETIARFDIF